MDQKGYWFILYPLTAEKCETPAFYYKMHKSNLVEKIRQVCEERETHSDIKNGLIL